MNDQPPLPLPSQIAPSLHLLLLTVRDTTNPEVSAPLAAAIDENTDWDAFVEAAALHSLSALALRGLRRCSATIPDVILERLRQQSVRAAGRALAQRREIARVGPLF